MDISKVKEGKHFNYRTSRGTDGRGKVIKVEQTARGAWITLHDKDRKKDVTLRAGQLTA